MQKSIVLLIASLLVTVWARAETWTEAYNKVSHIFTILSERPTVSAPEIVEVGELVAASKMFSIMWRLRHGTVTHEQIVDGEHIMRIRGAAAGDDITYIDSPSYVFIYFPERIILIPKGGERGTVGYMQVFRGAKTVQVVFARDSGDKVLQGLRDRLPEDSMFWMYELHWPAILFPNHQQAPPQPPPTKQVAEGRVTSPA